MKFVRWFLGRLILAVSFLTMPKSVVREQKEQDAIDAATAKMALYQFNACPFCVKIRRQLKRQALKIELRDAQHNPTLKEELVREGGKHQVPCLRIEDGSNGVTWLYESKAISAYLDKEFGQSSAA